MNTARLIAKTVPVNPEFGTTAAEFICYTARVSNPGNQWNHDTAGKLLDYLERERHWSPFEQFFINIEVVTTRDISRQILRHDIYPQEFSQRYALANMFCDPKEARLQDTKNRQNSIEIDNEELQRIWAFKQRQVIQTAKDAYEWAIDYGLAKECARVVLPEGLTMTTMYLAANVRNWLHYCQARVDKATQKEHRELAEQIRNILREVTAA